MTLNKAWRTSSGGLPGAAAPDHDEEQRRHRAASEDADAVNEPVDVDVGRLHHCHCDAHDQRSHHDAHPRHPDQPRPQRLHFKSTSQPCQKHISAISLMLLLSPAQHCLLTF